MFRCKECQAEYEIKPDYCDCGNDSFDEIIIEEQTQEENLEKNSVKILQENKKPEKEIVNEISTTKLQKQPSEISPLAWIFFTICIILSLLIIFIIGNPSAEEQNPSNITETLDAVEIPSLNALWNNELPKIETKNKKTAQKTQEIQTSAKTTTQTEAKKKSVNNKQEQKVQKTAPHKPKNIQKSTQTTKVTPAVNKQELLNYKIKLQNNIGSKIDFAKVVGDGSCVVTFKIANNGQLINRNFAVQSENTSLNDVVYNAVMQTPYVSAPPQSYKGETLRLSVKIYGGSFEVALN